MGLEDETQWLQSTEVRVHPPGLASSEMMDVRDMQQIYKEPLYA